MGKNLQNQDSKISLQNGNPGCMYNILHVLNRHRWHRVKKMLPSKRHTTGGGKHISDSGSSITTTDGEIEERINAMENSLIEEQQMMTGPSTHGTTKTSMKSRLIALITEEMSKRRAKHRRSSSYPTRLQLTRTNSIHHLESNSHLVESLPEIAAPPDDKSNEKKKCELCTAMLTMNYLKQTNLDHEKEKHLLENHKLLQENIEKRRRDFLEEPNKDTSIHQEINRVLDALDIFDLRKEFLLKMLQDTTSPLAHYLNNNHKRAILKSKIGLTKSVSFPVPGRRAVGLDELTHNEDCTTSKPMLTRQEESFNNNSASPRELKMKTQHENKVATNKRFKNLRQKIKHAIKESRKERRRVIMDAVFHKIPYGRRFSKYSKDEAALHNKFRKTGPATEKAHLRRSSSFNETLSKYSRLLDYSCSNREDKPQITPEREKLKLRQTDQTPCRSPSDRQSLKRLLSLPDLSSFLFLHSDDSPVRTPMDITLSLASTSTGLVADQQNQCLDTPAESGGQEKEIVVFEVDHEKFETGEIASSDHHDDKTEPTSSNSCIEVEKPSPDSVLDSPCQEAMSNPATIPISDELTSNDQSYMDSPTIDIMSTLDDQKTIAETPFLMEYDQSSEFPHHLELLDNIEVDNAEFHYVKDVLERSGFSTGNELLGAWHSNYQPVDPLLFDQLETNYHHGQQLLEEARNSHHDHLLLLFDVINEVLLEIYEKSFTYCPKPLTCRSQIHPMPVGYHVLEEVWSNINRYLSWRPEMEQLQSLDDAVSRDLAKGDGWMNLQFDAECVGLELEDMIFDDLLDELIFDDLLDELIWS